MSAVFDTPIRTSAQNLDRVLAAGRPALLVFETPNCGPCEALGPVLKELAAAYAGRALIVRVENAEEGNLASRFRLERVPTLIYWQSGKEVARIEGAAEATAVRSGIDVMLGAATRMPAASGPSVPLRGASAATRPPSSRPASSPGGTTQDSGPVVITDATFDAQVLQSSLPILVDFWAPWCGPCRMVSPIVEQLGREYAGRMRVGKVNTDENPMHASQLGIRGIPTLIFFKNGREVDRVVGAAPRTMLQTHVDRVLNGG